MQHYGKIHHPGSSRFPAGEYDYNDKPDGLGFEYNNWVYLNFHNSYYGTPQGYDGNNISSKKIGRSNFIGYNFDLIGIPMVGGIADGYVNDNVSILGGIVYEWRVFHIIITSGFTAAGLKINLN